jgi:hypothetical protein
MKPIDIRLIQARRQKIQAEIDALQAEFEKRIVALKAETKELDIAERVFSRLSLLDGPNPSAEKGKDRSSKSTGETDGKPEGLIPVTDMIREALTYAVLQGGVGLKPAGILAYIRGKWWPNAQANDVGPIAWRMWQNDQITKYEDGEYALIESEREALALEEEETESSGPM